MRPKSTTSSNIKGTGNSPTGQNQELAPQGKTNGTSGTPAKFNPLASEDSFLNTIEGLGLGQTEAEMAVDTGATTAHAGALEQLSKAQEAYNDVAAKFGSDSPMATAILAQVESLQKQHTPLKLTKSVVSLNSQVLRLQKDMEKHTSELAKIKASTEAKILDHRRAIESLEAELVKETEACESALKADHTALEKLQAEVDALNSARQPSPMGQVQAQATNPAPSITPGVIQKLFEVITSSGLLAGAVGADPQTLMAGLQQSLVTAFAQPCNATVPGAAASGLTEAERQQQLLQLRQQELQQQQQQQQNAILSQQVQQQAQQQEQQRSQEAKVLGKHSSPLPPGETQHKALKIGEDIP